VKTGLVYIALMISLAGLLGLEWNSIPEESGRLHMAAISTTSQRIGD
jgi:hypothetical protein